MENKNGNKIKVLQYISTGCVAGEVQHLLTLTKTINKKYFKVDAVCFEGHVADYLREKNISDYEVELHTIKFEGGNRFNTFLSLFRLIRKGKYQVVHIHPVSLEGISARLAAKLAGAKIVVTESAIRYQHVWENNPIKRFFLLDILHPIWNGFFLDHMITISKEVYNSIIYREKINPKKVSVIHYGIEIYNFQPKCSNSGEIKEKIGFDKNAIVIGTIARLVPQKGIPYLIDAFSKLQKGYDNLRLLLVGDGPLRASLEEQCKELSISNKVVFTGWVKNVAEILTAIDIFVLPSVFEPLGISILEALAAGKPVVASRVGGIIDIIVDRKTGLLVPPKDVDALVESIQKLLTDKQLSNQIVSFGQKVVKEQFNAKVMTDRIEEIYRMVKNK